MSGVSICGLPDGGRFVRRALTALFCAAALLLPSTFGAPAQELRALRGVALVIGQSDYEHLVGLTNPESDADAIEALLGDLGFESVRRTDRDAASLTRDLERFAEDAEDADVAVFYYSGHGIEAGGENFLIPVDADLSALDAAGEKLVPVSALIAKLQATVPVVILMLDACRNNPFPPGSQLRPSPGAEPIAVGMVGLGLSRGAASLNPAAPQSAPADENLGTVIAFAAEPGKKALDGDAGANSPYAAAILRHFDAMAGEEFGTVMRMVAEEVYLKTAGAQRPWVNESLRRLLYFGEAPEGVEGPEGDILRERRQLLVTIAALPYPEREQVESVAADSGIPMDAVYGILRALGSKAPDDPGELESLLISQTVRLKALLAERVALKSMDPEIVRVSSLADNAINDGALVTAIRLHQRAKSRVKELEKTVDEAEANIRARRMEFAEVYARSAQAYALAFEYLKAAEDFGQAFHQVERWDERLAWYYKQAEMVALTDHGDYEGDNASLERAITAGRDALGIADSLSDRDAWASTQNDLGNVLQTLGEREGGTARLMEAVEAYRAALGEWTRERVPLDWGMAQNNLGNALRALGERENGITRLDDAVAAYRAALNELTRERVPHDWAATQTNLGAALQAIGEREGSAVRLEEAVAAYRAALQELTRKRAPLHWAATQTSLGNALQALGEREFGTARLEEAVAAYHAALQELNRERAPLYWAGTHNDLGNALQLLGEREFGKARLEEAVAAHRAALEERTRERVPLDWAQTQTNLGDALRALGERDNDVAQLKEAITASRAAIEEWTRERVPLFWALAQNNLGNALRALGERENDAARLEEAITAFRTALKEWTRERVPLYWALTQNNLGNTLSVLGRRENSEERVREAIAAYNAALQERTRERVPLQWIMTQKSLGGALVDLGKLSRDKSDIKEGRSALAAAWDFYRQAGNDKDDGQFRDALAKADAVLASME